MSYLRDEEKTPAVCKICLGAIGRCKTLETSCGCKFHVNCLEGWYNINNTCPLCNIEQINIPKPIDIILKIEITQKYTGQFTDMLIEKYIGKSIRFITFEFERYGAPVTCLPWDKPFNKLLTKVFIKDLNKSCKKMMSTIPQMKIQ